MKCRSTVAAFRENVVVDVTKKRPGIAEASRAMLRFRERRDEAECYASRFMVPKGGFVREGSRMAMRGGHFSRFDHTLHRIRERHAVASRWWF